MDPQATWEEMLDAIAADNIETAQEYANNLLNWLYQGGFPPQPLTRVLPEQWDRMICWFICRKVIATRESDGGVG